MARLSVSGGVAELATPPLGDLDDHLRAVDVAPRVGRWGFLAQPDLPDAPGPAFLLVALRPAPTLQHYDPEAIDYWISQAGRGERRTLTRETPMPRSEDFSWGLIRLVDRLRVTNEYLTFGGHLDAAAVDEIVVAAFASPAPLLRRGGHSQGWDAGADAVGAFFGRLMVAVDFTPGFRGRAGGDIAAHALRGVRPRRGRTRADIVRSPDRRRPPAAAPLRSRPGCEGPRQPTGRPRAPCWSRPASHDVPPLTGEAERSDRHLALGQPTLSKARAHATGWTHRDPMKGGPSWNGRLRSDLVVGSCSSPGR